MGANNRTPRILEEQLLEEWKKARGNMPRKEFQEYISKKYNLLPNTTRTYITKWKIYDLDVNFRNNTPKEKRSGYHVPKVKEENIVEDTLKKTFGEEENKVPKEEANCDQKIDAEEKKELDKDETNKEEAKKPIEMPIEKFRKQIQSILGIIPVKQTDDIYINIALEIGKLVQEKNAQYGDSVNNTEEFLNILFPNGIDPENYKNIGVIVRVWDKLKRIANGNKGKENAWQDIAGYGILMCGSEENESL